MKIRIGIISTLLLLLITMFPMNASANEAKDEVNFFVRAIIPNNQIDKRATYYDLRMQPKEEQVLQVEITNKASKEVKINVSTVSASTNRNGVIDYETPDIKDETLKVPFSEISQVLEPEVVIPAGGKKTISVLVNMPEDLYDGVVLGGILFTKELENKETETETETTTIQNVYSYVIGVMLSETDTEVKPDFELLNVKSTTANYQPIVAHFIRNKESAIAKNISADLKIYKKDSKEAVTHVEKSNLEMAPNSVINLAASFENTKLNQGKYRSVIKLTYEGKTWDFEQEFEVTRKDIVEIDKNTVSRKSNSSMKEIIFIVVIALLVITIIILFILFFRQRKKGEEEKN